MNRAFPSLIVGAVLTVMSNSTLGAIDISGCNFPAAPEIPDGATATGDAMIAASKAVKEFVATAEAELKCLDDAKAAVGEEMSQEDLDVYTQAYNGQVDLLNETANGFNEQVRVYKSREE